MSLDVRTSNDVTILTPKGMLLGGKETDELQGKIKELGEAGTGSSSSTSARRRS